MRYAIAPTKNIRALDAAAEALTTRAPGVPGMGLVFGPTGFGKTTAAARLRNNVDGIYVRANALWTPRALLEAIARELRRHWAGSCARTMDAICEDLERAPRPVLLDEADYVLRTGRMVDALRDLHDATAAPVILIGMPPIEGAIKRWPQVTGRLMQWVEFRPCDFDDAALLARMLCDVAVEAALLERLHREAGGEIRSIVVGLSHIEAFGRARGLDPVTSSDWGKERLLFSAQKAARSTQPSAPRIGTRGEAFPHLPAGAPR